MITTPAPQIAETRPKKRLRDKFLEWMVFHHYSPRTIEAYIARVRDFVVWSGKRDPLTMGAAEVNAYLSDLASERRVTASTQRQALNALVRFYDGCLGLPLGDIGKFTFASTPERLPVVMSTGEVRRVIEALPPVFRTMGKLMYGCGLRLMECCRLRVKDVDFERMVLSVREGKGDKDRNVPLPLVVVAELRAHLEFNRARFEADGAWPVHLPGALRRKFPGYEREWRWQYVFAAKSLSTDPEDARLKMHHLHENSLQKAVHAAVARVGLTKRVTCHTFRHSFATHLLESGTGIEDIKALLGHSRLETTLVYLHVAMPLEKRIKSPLDA